MDFLISVGHNFTTVQFMVAGIVLVVLFLVGLSAFKLRRGNATRLAANITCQITTAPLAGSAPRT
jgi:nitrate reductase gamma subunit